MIKLNKENWFESTYLFLFLEQGNFLVVSDAVPGGLEPINTHLATSSQVDSDKISIKLSKRSFWHKHSNWELFSDSRWGFYHTEKRHDSVRFYSEYLSAGNYHLSYVAQAISPGKFVVLASHAEEMYDADVFGKSALGELIVKELQ